MDGRTDRSIDLVLLLLPIGIHIVYLEGATGAATGAGCLPYLPPTRSRLDTVFVVLQ